MNFHKFFFVSFLMLAVGCVIAGCSDSQTKSHRTAMDPTVNVVKRERAVGWLSDQALLTDIAKNADKASVRRAAIMKLTSQATLAAIAKTAPATEDLGDVEARLAAVLAMKDLALLDDVAKNAICPTVREVAEITRNNLATHTK